MSERKDYKTRQRDAVRDCFALQPARSMTADEVYQQLKRRSVPVGRTTVYRAIARLHEQGMLISLTDQHTSPPLRYQFRDITSRHISVRCSACGVIAALDCEVVNAFERHLSREHGFTLSQSDCVLPGLCSACRKHSRSKTAQ